MRSSRIMLCFGSVFAVLGFAGAASAADGVWSRSGGWQVSWNDNDRGCTAVHTSSAQEFVHLTISGEDSRLIFFSPSWTFIQTGEKYRLGLLFDGKRYWGGQSLGVAAGGVFGLGVGATSGLLKDFAKKRGVRIFLDGDKKPLATYSLTGSFRALNETVECAEARARGGLQNL